MSYKDNQFAKPRGIKGKVAGWFMSAGKGNLARCSWAIQQMQLQPSDTVLEIGFGPGISIENMSKTITTGCIYGVDESRVMVETAGKRNKEAIMSGKVKLFRSSANDLPHFDKKINKVLTVNSFEFWDDKAKALNDLKRYMDIGGQIFIMHQALHKTGEPGIDVLSETYGSYLKQSGFNEIAIMKDSSLNILCVKGII